MTWSIVAHDPETGYFGIAIATRFFAAGALCPWTEAKVGAISTQATMNPTLGPRGLALLREGAPAPAALEMLMRADEGRVIRQVHLIDTQGCSAAYTGADCIDWAGQRAAEAVSVAGNMLAGAAVIEETLAAYQANLDTPFVARLLLAMDAGEAAGGDKRGRQSAALVIQGPEPYRRLDMRVDDHAAPLPEARYQPPPILGAKTSLAASGTKAFINPALRIVGDGLPPRGKAGPREGVLEKCPMESPIANTCAPSRFSSRNSNKAFGPPTARSSARAFRS